MPATRINEKADYLLTKVSAKRKSEQSLVSSKNAVATQAIIKYCEKELGIK